MKKVILSDISTTVGMPEKAGTLLHIQSAYNELFSETIKAIIGDHFSSAIPYRIQGLINTGGTVSAGSIFYANEIFRVDSFSLPSPANAQIVTTFYTATEADPVEFTDGIPRNVHEIRKINFISGTPVAPLGFTFQDLKDVTYIPYTITNGTPSPTIKFDKPNRYFRSFVVTGETTLTITLDATGAKDGTEVLFLFEAPSSSITFTHVNSGFTTNVMGIGGTASPITITISGVAYFLFRYRAYIETFAKTVSLNVVENT